MSNIQPVCCLGSVLTKQRSDPPDVVRTRPDPTAPTPNAQKVNQFLDQAPGSAQSMVLSDSGQR